MSQLAINSRNDTTCLMDRKQTLTMLRTKVPAVALDLGVNVLLPYLIYNYAAPTLGDVKALLASSLPPIAWSLIEFVRNRRLDVISLMVLAGIILSLLAFIGGGGARMLQLREKLVSGVIGLAFLVSAAIRRPLIYEFARAGMARRGSPEYERLGKFNDDRLFRRSMTIMTVVWGFALILDVAIGSVMIFELSISEYLLLGPIEGYAFMGGLALWTFWYSRRSKARNEALRAMAANPPDKDKGHQQQTPRALY